MRVATDGKLLAASDAAVSLMGATNLGEVLDSSLVDRLRGERIAELWSDFVTRVSEGGSASAETELEDLAGTKRAVILQGIGLPDHPDGIRSMLVTARDVSGARRLAASLEEEERLRLSLQASLTDATASVEQLRKNLVAIATERKDLQAALATVLLQRPNISQSVEQLRSALTAIMDAATAATPAQDQEPK
jgi:hypothetical protein